MNTEMTIHPKLQHCGVTTGNLDGMLEWYGKVLGMRVNKRVAAPAGSPFKTVAFASNDQVNHRLSFFETPGLPTDGDKDRHARVQHIAFEYETLDDLLGTYVRLKNIGMLPLWAADQFIQTAIYYEDPDGTRLLRDQRGRSRRCNQQTAVCRLRPISLYGEAWRNDGRYSLALREREVSV